MERPIEAGASRAAAPEPGTDTEQPAVTRAAAFAALGHGRPLPEESADELEGAVTGDPDPRVRAAALGALVRAGDADAALTRWHDARGDAVPHVRRRVADLAPALAARSEGGTGAEGIAAALVATLSDPDVTVVVGAAWALGELGGDTLPDDGIATLTDLVSHHRDALAREAAVGALGALADPAGLPAILAACDDKPAIRRRAVLALAPFEGELVDAALRRALDDRDWQVRQAAEDLLG